MKEQLKSIALELAGNVTRLLAVGEEDDRLRCPNCKRSEWTIRNYSELNCNYCYGKFNNYGKFGLVKIK